MLENILIKRNCSLKLKFTIKSLLSAALVASAVILPQIIHAALGASGGVQWMPMYLPVLLGGCLLGTFWGLGIGVMSPVISFLITLGANSPMPAAPRLPFMILELAVFAAISGLFAKKIASNGWLAFPAVLSAQIAGRCVFMFSVIIFQSITPFTPAAVWLQIQTGLSGIILQAAVVPFMIMGLKKLLERDKND